MSVMANDIEGLTSNETFSQPFRADLHVNQPDRRPNHRGNCPVTMNFDSVTDIAHFKGENLASDNCTVPNGCVRHLGIDESVYSLAPNGDDNRSFSSVEPEIYSAGSEDNGFSHDIIKLSEVLETAGTNCRNSSTKLLTKECATSDSALLIDGHVLPGFAEEVRKGGEENDNTNSVTDLFGRTKISNDLQEVPLEPVNDKKLLAVDEGLCGLKRLSGECGNEIEYTMYESEKQMPYIMSLITKDLSEPYSIYTYRYFIHNWPDLCFLVRIFIFQTCIDIHKYLLFACSYWDSYSFEFA